MSKKYIKEAFPLPRKSLFTYRNAFKNTFPLNGKIKLAVAGVSQNRRKKMEENQFAPAEIRLFFKNWVSHFPQTGKKSLNNGILFQIKSVSTSGNGEFVLEYVSIRPKNCFHWQEYPNDDKKNGCQ